MDLSIVERLICPEDHASTPLIVRADRVERGRLVEGLLGCPVCRREWSVSGGTARFGARAANAQAPATSADVIGALLGLTEPGLVVLDGAPNEVARALVEQFGCTVVGLDCESDGELSCIDGAARVPVAPGAARGIALLREDRSAAFADSAAVALARNGRMMGTVGVPVPAMMRELARDERLWVAEPLPSVVPLTVRR